MVPDLSRRSLRASLRARLHTGTALGLLALLVLGCTSERIVEVEKIVYVPVPTTTWQELRLQVDWTKVAGISSAGLRVSGATAQLDGPVEITHIGSRLVYPKENAAFTQSVVRGTGSTSLLTLRVPPTDTADLYVVAVADGPSGRRALKMAVKRGIRVNPSAPVLLTTDSLNLIDAEWRVDDPSISTVGDTARVTAATSPYFLPIKVLDPYQVNQQLNFSNTIIKFWGTGTLGLNPDGWRRFGIQAVRGEGPATITGFQPYVDGSLFNLSNDFPIGPPGVMQVRWP